MAIEPTDLANDPGEIERAFRERTQKSAELARRAGNVLPSGIVHDARRFLPYALYATHAKGARKWDVDGHEYLDFFGGHGALVLGHSHPKVVEAAQAQMAKGSHFAAANELEVEWAEMVCELVPSAEKVRFHSSGSESTQMAARLARAHTGREKILRFNAHYHGWQDDWVTGFTSHFDNSAAIGIPEHIAAATVTLDPYNEEAVRSRLSKGDIAAVILEPIGANTGKVPLEGGFLQNLRDWTSESGTLLIFDEIVTGFRLAPGGAQEVSGITPDLTTLAKIVAGGLPGGAVCGRADLFDSLDFDASARRKREKIFHMGTFNGCPVSAAAAVATLKILRDEGVCDKINALGAQMRERLADLCASHDLPWVVYGDFSAFHLYFDLEKGEAFEPRTLGFAKLKAPAGDTARMLRMAMNIHGVDLSLWPGGMFSGAHEESDIDMAIAAFDRSIQMLKADGVVPA